jgi:hypothetical protein
MLKKTFLYSIVSIALAGCAPGSVIRLSPEFAKASIRDATAGVVICKDRIQIGIPEEVDRCLGAGDPVVVFQSFFADFFAPKLKGACGFKNVVMLQDFDQSLLHEKHFEGGGKESWDIMVPGGAHAVPDNLQYLLIFSRIAVGEEFKPGTQAWLPVAGSSTIKQLSIKISAIVTLWDNVMGKEVAYGILNIEAGSKMIIVKSTWLELLDGVAIELARKMNLRAP